MFLIIAFGAWGQTCPGPANRQALINLQKSGILNGTRAYQIPMTDTCGNQRYVTIDSIITIVVDSIGSDTALQRNWYTHDGTTVNPLRTATIDSAAQWLGDNADGFLYFQMGTLAGGRAYIDTDESSIYFGDLGGVNTVEANTTGIDITTSATASRAVDLTTDTVNMIASFDPTLMTVNLLSDGTYFAADSLKIVGIGQFPDFPNLNYDGTEKGVFYDVSNEVLILNGNGTSGYQSFWSAGSDYLLGKINSDIAVSEIEYSASIGGTTSTIIEQVISEDGTHSALISFLQCGDPASTPNLWSILHSEKDTNERVSIYFGESEISNQYYVGDRAFGVRSYHSNSIPFDWIQSYIPNDTTENAVSFYNHAYYFKNEHPAGAAGDTLFHFWAATGAGGEAGSDPGFMTLDDIRGPGGGDNWYTADGTTTDPHRIATVSGVATWTSNDSILDGSVPFRFEITGIMNEPESTVWYFENTDDSLMIAHSDVEILLQSSTSFNITADAAMTILSDATIAIGADSVIINNGTLPTSDEGDILVVTGADASNRTVKTLEGTFNADQLSWAAGAAGDKWEAVPANRTSIATTTVNLIPAESQVEIIVTPTGGGTVELNYTPAMPASGYTTTRWIYNAAAGATTVETDQDWQFQDSTGDLGADFVLAAGENCKLIWIYNATAADARFFVVKL